MDMDKIVCNCYSITNGGIKEAVDNGATTLEEVQEATGAGTICGACLEDVQRLVDEFVAEKEQVFYKKESCKKVTLLFCLFRYLPD